MADVDSTRSGTERAAEAAACRAGFVGRAHELASLSSALREALDGVASFVLVDGEAGIGKTWLLDELAERARGCASVYWGRAWEGEGAPGYWPWVQVFRAYARDHDVTTLPELPGVADSPGAPPPTVSEPEQARFRLFDGIARVLRAGARERPLVLLLDDVHCADGDSLRLLEFLATQLADCRVLVAASHRTGAAPAGALVDRALAAVQRRAHARRLSLRGLATTDVARLLEHALGRAPAPRLVAAVHRRTDGNPLFVAALLPFLESCDVADPEAALSSLGLPSTVRSVVAVHLRLVPEGSRALLDVASVIGRDLDPALLASALGASPEAVLAALDPVRRLGLVVADGNVRGRYRFAHVLLRDALYDELPLDARLAHHHRVGLVLESRDDDGPTMVTAAHHLLEALPLGDRDRAVDCACEAARRALAQHSYDTASALLRRALAALEVAGSSSGRRCRVLLALGDAQRAGGRIPEARQSYLDAAALAREAGDAELFASAALGTAEPWTDFGTVDDVRARLLEEALLRLGDAATPLRFRVIARLAPSLHGTRSYERMVALVRESVDGARQSGDELTQLFALGAAHLTMRGAAHLSERESFAREMRALAARRGDAEMLVRAYLMALPDALERGDVAAYEADLAVAARLADELRQPRYLWQVLSSRAALASLRGDFGEAEHLAREGRDVGERGHVTLAVLFFFGLVASMRRVQGRFAEVVDEMMIEIARATPNGAIRLYGAMGHLAHGRRDTGAAIFAREADDLAALPQDVYWTFTMSLLAELCAELGDAVRARAIYAALAPYAERTVVLGTVAACEGSVSRPLGLLAATAGDLDLAVRHLDRALVANERLQAWPYLVRTQCAQAEVLLARRAPGDTERARALIDAATPLARRLGLGPPLDRPGAAPSVRAAAPRVEDGAQAHPAAPPLNEFRLEGDYWSIAFAGKLVRLRRMKGLAYLAALIVHAGRELHVLDLASGADGGARPWRGDERSRVLDLRAGIAEADAHHDLARGEVLRRELDSVTSELAEASGLAGRARRAGSAVERARVSVRNDVSRALSAIRAHHPELWRHLFNAVRTGTVCSYRPERATRWVV